MVVMDEKMYKGFGNYLLVGCVTEQTQKFLLGRKSLEKI